MTEFLLIRHAVTDAVDHFYAGRMEGLGLNDLGRAQAGELAAQLAGIRIDAIYSSPLERCRQTAEPIARQQGVDVAIEDALVEFDIGDWTGKRFDELRQDERFARFNKFRSGTRAPGGEVAIEVQARMVAAVLALAERHPRQTIGVVGHSDPLQSVLTYFLGIPVEIGYRLSVDPASVNILELSENDARVKLVNHRGPITVTER